jgi:hypothetical protein
MTLPRPGRTLHSCSQQPRSRTLPLP